MNSTVLSQRPLLRQMAYISMLVGTIIFLLTIITKPIFAIIALIIVIINGTTLLLDRSGNTAAGLHLLFTAHLIAFTIAPFVGLAGMCDIMIFPVLYVWALLSFDNHKIALFYILLNSICCIITILKLRSIADLDSLWINSTQDMLISIGIMFSLYFITKGYFKRLNEEQSTLIEKEKTIKKQNEELKEYIDTNLQLENFAHLASHELKTPVRGISNYAGLLKKSAGDRLQTNETEYLDFITNQSQRMYQLTNDLLELSKLSSGHTKKKAFSPSQMLHELVSSQYAQYSNAISIGGLPSEIFANEEEIRSLFVNIIDNSIKYAHPDRPLEISIESTAYDDFYRFEIMDNGIGISDEYKDRAFLIFKRLQSDGEGTGIGLAICKTIVEKHNGHSKLMDNPEGGLIYQFSLPA